MSPPRSDHLYVNLSPSQTRRRLKGVGLGVRRVESAGTGRALIVHTATGDHLHDLRAIFTGYLDPEEPAEDGEDAG